MSPLKQLNIKRLFHFQLRTDNKFCCSRNNISDLFLETSQGREKGQREGNKIESLWQQIGMRTTHVCMLAPLRSSNRQLCSVSSPCPAPVRGNPCCRSSWQCFPPDGLCSGNSARDNHSQLHLITLSRMNTSKSWAQLFKMEILISRSVRKYSNKVAN